MNITDRFCWYHGEESHGAAGTPEERYQRIVDWASRARGMNPNAFDEVSAWLQGADGWSHEEMAENGKLLMEGIIGRFSEQTRRLRAELEELAPAGIVNMAVFEALDALEDELARKADGDEVREAANRVLSDFSAIKERRTRELFAGSVTGPEGTDSVEIFGYINCLEVRDAGVQWALFMPDVVKQQQNGFRMESFEYRKLPALRFIGVEGEFRKGSPEMAGLLETLDSMDGYRSGFDYDMVLIHHFGRGVDVEHCHCVWGRFMAAGAPVPEGYAYIDFVPQNDGKAGMPYLSQFAFARFTGETESMHREEGFDCDAMYDVTRNTILGQNVIIPYPDKYWTAEVYLEGFEKESTAYLFSVER